MEEVLTRVLLVEDNAADTRLIRAVLRDAGTRGLEFVCVEGLEPAFERLSRGDVDLVLWDLPLPDGAGTDAFAGVRALAPDAPILVLTGIDDETRTVAAVREGADDHLIKEQLDGDALARAIHHAVERRREDGERRRLEAQIQHAQKLESLGVLAGGIAHDFNNLLMGILGHASLAVDLLAPDAPARRSLEQIETAALRATDLTRQLLAYSGRAQFVMEPLNLSRLVEETAHLLETVVSKRAVLKLDFAVELPDIEGDPSQVGQVIMNLITNAADAIDDPNGVITLCTRSALVDREYLKQSATAEDLPEGRYVFLEVTDTGCGMDEETTARIFDPFFTTKLTGRGLGLAAVLGIVRGHGGAIKVESAPGRGTTFRVLFPLAGSRRRAAGGPAVGRQLELFPAGQGPDASPEVEWRGSGTVLVVDDEESVRCVAREMLERFGFDVLTAADGREAVELFRDRADEMAAVLLDVTMPQMNGKETFRELRRVRRDVPVILSSGYSEQEAATRFGRRGATGFIQKPYRPNALASKMRQALER